MVTESWRGCVSAHGKLLSRTATLKPMQKPKAQTNEAKNVSSHTLQAMHADKTWRSISLSCLFACRVPHVVKETCGNAFLICCKQTTHTEFPSSTFCIMSCLLFALNKCSNVSHLQLECDIPILQTPAVKLMSEQQMKKKTIKSPQNDLHVPVKTSGEVSDIHCRAAGNRSRTLNSNLLKCTLEERGNFLNS